MENGGSIWDGENILEYIVAMVAQHCEHAQRYWIAHFKLANMVSSMFCVFFHNKKKTKP